MGLRGSVTKSSQNVTFLKNKQESPLEMYATVPAWKREPVRVLSLFGKIGNGEYVDIPGDSLEDAPAQTWVCGALAPGHSGQGLSGQGPNLPSVTLSQHLGQLHASGAEGPFRGLAERVRESWGSLLQKTRLGKEMQRARQRV